MQLTDEIAIAVANLQDVYMNAGVVRRAMRAAPISETSSPEAFMWSDRGRLERIWTALLWVLVEAWNSDQMQQAREYLASVVDLARLKELVTMATTEPHRTRFFHARGYMFHRDKREYWNEGRLGPIGHLKFQDALHDEFSAAILSGMREVNRARGNAG